MAKDMQSAPRIMYVWRGLNLTMTVFFALAVVVNVNDSDWYLWCPVYLVPAILSGVLVLNPSIAEHQLWVGGTVIHLTLCCAYALYQVVLLIEAIANWLENPLQQEEGREMGGLLIIITWLAMSRFTNIGRPNASVSSKSYMSALLLMTITLTVLPLFVWSLCFVSDWHTRLGHCTGMFTY